MRKLEHLLHDEAALDAFLERYRRQELLRFVALGSVDDGKSTLIGRLLYECGAVYEDQLEAVRRVSEGRGAGPVDFALLTDGLEAERAQGITIDVAYRYFWTECRTFILADAPGHERYTRNAVTGASHADVALVLVDARFGLRPQSRRHAAIASLMGVGHLLVCVNKMDLVGYDRAVFERIARAFEQQLLVELRFDEVHFVPTSALHGDNVVERSERMPWYTGPSVLGYLESVRLRRRPEQGPLRFPVQLVLRPSPDYRGYAGRLASGRLRVGDELLVLPSGERTRLAAIDAWEGERAEARAPESVVLRLRDELDVGRGDMLVDPERPPRVLRRFDADLVWMDERPLDPAKTYLLKHTTQWVRAQIERVHWVLDMERLQRRPAERLQVNDIGRVTVRCHRALYVDPYEQVRATGAFILVDSLHRSTAAAGMIVLQRGAAQTLQQMLREARAGSALQPGTQISPQERWERMGQRGLVVWLTGLPGSGRWWLAFALERRLFDLGRTVTVLDPRGEQLPTIASAAKACADAGLIAICAFPSYLRGEREQVRAKVGAERFFEVYVNTDPALCRERRPEAQPQRFEPPERPDVTVALHRVRLDEAVELIVRTLGERDAGRPAPSSLPPGRPGAG